MFEADYMYLDYVGRHTFHGFFARHRSERLYDAESSTPYCPENPPRSVPPSLLAVALLLQAHDQMSDAEAKRRADLDLSWRVALGSDMDERPLAKSILQLFRAQLILHDQTRAIVCRSLEYARENACWRSLERPWQASQGEASRSRRPGRQRSSCCSCCARTSIGKTMTALA